MKTGIYWQDPEYPAKGMNFIFDSSLVLYLPLHRLDGTSFRSKDKHGHPCTVTGALWTPSGRSFDGLDDYIDCGKLGSFGSQIGSHKVTIESWVKIPSGTTAIIAVLGVLNTGTVTMFQLEINVKSDGAALAGGLNVMVRDEDANGLYAGVDSDTGIVDGEWHHLVAVIDAVGNDVKFHLDTTLLTADYHLQTTPDNTADFGFPLPIGARNLRGTIEHFFDGLIGEVRLYNRALTPLEIQHNYLATKPRYRA